MPQRRERLFIIGARQGTPLPPGFPPLPTHGTRLAHSPSRGEQTSLFESGLLPEVSIGEALSNLPGPEVDGHGLPNHTYSKYKLDFNGYLGHRPLDPARPAPTVTARGDERGGVVVLPHPSGTRRMTARELAVVQSFPLDFVFWGSQTSAYRQIANAAFRPCSPPLWLVRFPSKQAN